MRWRLPGTVKACAFSRDGRILVAAGGDKAIHLFDAETGRPLRQLQYHKTYVECLAFSSDGKTLASGDADGKICLCDWPSGKVLRQFVAHERDVHALAFAGTGKFLASGGADALVRLWDPATGRELRRYEGHKVRIQALAVSPDGRLVVSSTRQPSDHVQLWEAASGRLLHRHKAAYWVGEALAFSPDSKLVLLPVEYMKLGLWDVASGKITRQFDVEQHGGISAVSFSPDGRIIASASEDCSLVLCDPAAGKIIHQLTGRNVIRHPGGATCLCFTSDGRRHAFSLDHSLHVWEVAAWREVCPMEGHAKHIYRLLFSPDKRSLITASEDTKDPLQKWDITTGKRLRILLHESLMGKHGFQLSPDQAVLSFVHSQQDNLVVVFQDTTTGKELHRALLPFNSTGGYSPSMILLSPNGKILTSHSRAGELANVLLLRDTVSGNTLGRLPEIWNEQFLFSPDSNLLACFDDRSRLELFHMPQSRIVCKIPLAEKINNSRSVVFSPDGRLLAVASSSYDGSRTGRIDVRDTITGQKRVTLTTGARTRIAGLEISPDSTLLATGDSEGTVHLWSIATGKEVLKRPGHRGLIESLTFAHDGKLLASGSWDTTTLVWDIREMAEAARPRSADMPRERLERLWTDLASEDGERVNQAIWNLATARRSVSWIGDHVTPVPSGDEKRIARLIADLDSDNFAVREKATHDLAELGAEAKPALRKILAGNPSLELRRRVEPIVKQPENWQASSPATRRQWRAVEVLELLGTPEARKLLQKLANGLPDARLTREAKAALHRLASRCDTIP